MKENNKNPFYKQKIDNIKYRMKLYDMIIAENNKGGHILLCNYFNEKRKRKIAGFCEGVDNCKNIEI